MRHLEVPKSIKCEEPPQHVNLCLRNQGVKFSTLIMVYVMSESRIHHVRIENGRCVHTLNLQKSDISDTANN